MMLLQVTITFLATLLLVAPGISIPALVSVSSEIPESAEKMKEAALYIKDEFEGHFSDPSAKAAVLRHIDDMTFIHVPKGNDERGERNRRLAVKDPEQLWPNCQVPYFISTAYSTAQREVILRAMRHWEDNTCVRFVPALLSHTHYVYIFPGDGCSSFVGRQDVSKQPQGLSLDFKCIRNFGICVHELGHVLGFYHEQSRPDRDQYVEVNTDNIRDGYEKNFNKENPENVTTLGYSYDYASIMHYGPYDFANSSNHSTLDATKEGFVFGQAQELSPLDILKTNKLCNCSDRHPPISTFPKSELPLSLPTGVRCGAVMEGTSGVISTPGYPNHRYSQDCTWVVRVPDGFTLRLSFYWGLTMEESYQCLKDYIVFLRDCSLDYTDAWYLPKGPNIKRLCSPSQVYLHTYVPASTMTIYYHTDGNNYWWSSPRGVAIYWKAEDIDECALNHRCHNCTNTHGSYVCECDDGYYHSPAANTCFDINECAYDNGGCHHLCENCPGSYKCECNPGYELQDDGLSCSRAPPPDVTSRSTVTTAIPSGTDPLIITDKPE